MARLLVFAIAALSVPVIMLLIRLTASLVGRRLSLLRNAETGRYWGIVVDPPGTVLRTAFVAFISSLVAIEAASLLSRLAVGGHYGSITYAAGVICIVLDLGFITSQYRGRSRMLAQVDREADAALRAQQGTPSEESIRRAISYQASATLLGDVVALIAAINLPNA